MRLSSLALAVVAAVVAYSLYRRDDGKATIVPVTSNAALEKHLDVHRDALGEEYGPYRNHCLRVLSYTKHFLSDEGEPLSGEQEELVVAALAYHDIGLWTDGTLSYLEPSAARARGDLAGAFSAAQLDTIQRIMDNHHKLTPYSGPDRALVDAVRRGDWVDATKGVVHHGMSKANIRAVEMAIPNEGFHDILLAFGPRLHGRNVAVIVRDIAQIFKL